MQINRKCGQACVNYHLSALKPLRSFGPTQHDPTIYSALYTRGHELSGRVHTQVYNYYAWANALGLQHKLLITPLSE